MGKAARDQWQESYITCKIEVRTALAHRVAKTLLFPINKLSYAPDQAKRFLPASQFEVIMKELTEIILGAYHALEADRAMLAELEKKYHYEVLDDLNYENPRLITIKCKHILSRVLTKLLEDLVAMDERWATIAWSAEVARKEYSPEESEFAAYMQKQNDWLDRMMRLRSEIIMRLKLLKQAGHTKSATPRDKMGE